MRLPWADLVLFAAIAGVLAIWWLNAPEALDSPGSVQSVLSTQRVGATPTVGLVAALQLDDPTSTPSPTLVANAPTVAATETLPPSPTPVPGPVRHQVVAGESVAVIAGKYGSTIHDIIQANSLRADGRLSVGQELLIPVAGPSGGPGPTPTTSPAGLMYTVKSGDTIIGLAERYNSRADWIMQANGMNASDTLHIGRALLIPLVPATPTPTPTTPVTPLPPPPTEVPDLAAPQLLTPGDAAIITGQESVLLSWASVGVLAAEEWYVVTLKSPDKETPIETWWTKSTSWRLPAKYSPTGNAGVDYSWCVQVRRGSADQPGEAISSFSADRRFTWR